MTVEAKLQQMDALEAVAFASFASWLEKTPDALAAYRADTGDTYRPPNSAIELMIDQSCGADVAFAESFLQWALLQWRPAEDEA